MWNIIWNEGWFGWVVGAGDVCVVLYFIMCCRLRSIDGWLAYNCMIRMGSCGGDGGDNWYGTRIDGWRVAGYKRHSRKCDVLLLPIKYNKI